MAGDRKRSKGAFISEYCLHLLRNLSRSLKNKQIKYPLFLLKGDSILSLKRRTLTLRRITTTGWGHVGEGVHLSPRTNYERMHLLMSFQNNSLCFVLDACA